MKNRKLNPSFAIILSLFIGLLLGMTATVFGQTEPVAQNEDSKTAPQVEKKTVLKPIFTAYRGIKIGMTADEVREALDKKPKIADKDGFYYVFNDEESAQIVLDKDQKVKVISIIYSGKNSEAPAFEDVFGKEVTIPQMPDGRIYNLIRYPENGFWVAYNRSAGDDPTVTITMQKIQTVQ